MERIEGLIAKVWSWMIVTSKASLVVLRKGIGMSVYLLSASMVVGVPMLVPVIVVTILLWLALELLTKCFLLKLLAILILAWVIMNMVNAVNYNTTKKEA